MIKPERQKEKLRFEKGGGLTNRKKLLIEPNYSILVMKAKPGQAEV
jgi:hypothetical protein